MSDKYITFHLYKKVIALVQIYLWAIKSYMSVWVQYISVQAQYIDIYNHINIHFHIHIHIYETLIHKSVRAQYISIRAHPHHSTWPRTPTFPLLTLTMEIVMMTLQRYCITVHLWVRMVSEWAGSSEKMGSFITSMIISRRVFLSC